MENNNTALNGIKMMIADGIVSQEAAEKYFPELKKSKDERTQLTDFLWDLIYKGSSFRYKREDFERWKSWLKKQGEQKPYSGVSFEYNGHTWGMCARDNGVDILLDKQLLKHLVIPGEQKNEGMNLEEGKMTPFQKKVFCIIDLDVEEEHGLKQVCDELLALASNEIKQKSNTVLQELNGEDEKTRKELVDFHKNAIEHLVLQERADNAWSIRQHEKFLVWLANQGEQKADDKAKRYDDLLVRLQEAKVNNDVCDERYCCVIDDIVPELKEKDVIPLLKKQGETFLSLQSDLKKLREE